MIDTAIASRAMRAHLCLIATLALLLSACAAPESSESEDTAAAELRAYFEGTAPIPGAEGRARHRAELARLATRSSGARRAGLDPDAEEGWWPVGERAAGEISPADTSVWQRDGDIDATGAFMPVRGACPTRAPVDIAALPEEIRRPGPEERGPAPEAGRPELDEHIPGPELEERAGRLACALDRLAGSELHIAWAPRQSRAAVVDPAGGGALVNPRLLALVEPAAPAPGAPGAAPPPQGGDAPAGGSPPEDTLPDGPPVEPLDQPGGDNEHHPRPPENDTGGSSRTFCDRVCDDVWNDVFDCDCNGSPGAGSSDGCDCGGSPGSSSSGCSNGACRCGTAHRGAQDRTGVLVAAIFAGTLVLRRRRGARRAGRRFPWLFLVLGILACPRPALAAPPKLVDVHVTVSPPEAALFVDGNAVVPERGVVRLPGGSHTFSAKLDGYSDATQTIEVQQGGTGTLVTLRLVADRGYLVITGRDPAATLAIDGVAVGRGSHSGLVTPGNHVITATDAAGRPRSYVVTVIAGQSITMSVDGPPTYFPPSSPPPPPSTPPPPSEKKPAAPRIPPPKGPYVVVNATMLWQTGRPYGFEHGDTPAPGFAVGGRGGYRFTEVVGLEMLLEYGRISNGGVVAQTYGVDQDGDGVVSGAEAATDRSAGGYAMESLRIGPVLRLTTAGRENRFLAGLGLGALHETISLDHADLVWDAASARYASTGTFHHSYEGWSPFLLFEGGYERSIQAFLAAVVAQITVESVSGIEGDPYNSALQARFGLCLRVGYAAW